MNEPELKDSSYLTLNEIREAISSLAAKLTIPRKRFADEYLANGENATKAYLSVFSTNNYGSAAVSANRLLKRPDVKSYIELCKQFTTDELLNHLTVSSSRVLDEEAKLAFVDVRKMFDIEGNFLEPKYWPEDIARACAGLEIEKKWNVISKKYDYKYKIKLNDKGRSLQRLEAVLGMNKMPSLGDDEKELFKSFLESIDGDSRGTLPAELEDAAEE